MSSDELDASGQLADAWTDKEEDESVPEASPELIAPEGFAVPAMASEVPAAIEDIQLKRVDTSLDSEERTMLPIELEAAVEEAKRLLASERSEEAPLGPFMESALGDEPAESASAQPLVGAAIDDFNRTRRMRSVVAAAAAVAPLEEDPGLKSIESGEMKLESTRLPIESDEDFELAAAPPPPPPAPPRAAAMSAAAPAVPPPPPQPEPQRAGVPEQPLSRQATVRYFKVMQPLQNFPLEVAIARPAEPPKPANPRQAVVAGQHHQIAATRPKLVLVPCFPGCLVVPPMREVDVSPNQVKASFAVTPLVEGTLSDARLEIYYDGRCLEEMALPAVVAKTAFARTVLAAGVLIPLITGLADFFGYKPSAGSTYAQLMQRFEPQWVSMIIPASLVAGLGLVLASGVLFYFKRPRRSRPMTSEISTI
jgi:hypothetical protein